MDVGFRLECTGIFLEAEKRRGRNQRLFLAKYDCMSRVAAIRIGSILKKTKIKVGYFLPLSFSGKRGSQLFRPEWKARALYAIEGQNERAEKKEKEGEKLPQKKSKTSN